MQRSAKSLCIPAANPARTALHRTHGRLIRENFDCTHKCARAGGPTHAWKGAGWDARREHDAARAPRIPIPCKWACKLICHRKMLPRDRSRLARWVGRGGSAFPACTCAPPAAHPDAKLAASPCRWRARHDASRACTAREARQTHRGDGTGRGWKER